MREIAILGAGEIGGAAAHVLARLDVARSIRLVDESGTVAGGKALDIAQAGPIDGFATQLSGTTDIARAAGASIIVVADRTSGGEWTGDEGARLLARVARMAPQAIVLCAGATQRDVIDRAVGEFRLDHRRVLGTAPEALASGARALCALALNGSPRDVSLAVAGSPPAQMVVLWQSATVAGSPLHAHVDEPVRRRLQARIAAAWPPGPYALACAVAAAVDAIAGRSRRIVSCFVGPDRSAGAKTKTAALPVRLGTSGMIDVVLPEMSAAERIALDASLSV